MATEYESRKAYFREYYLKNKDRILTKQKGRERTTEQLKYHREWMASYLKNNPQYRDRQNKLRYIRDVKDRPGTRKRYRNWHKQKKEQVFSLLGNTCVCCGETRKEFLSLDHINGGGHKHRVAMKGRSLWPSVLKDPDILNKYRLLCFNCNMSRGFYGYCPHDKEDFNAVGVAC